MAEIFICVCRHYGSEHAQTGDHECLRCPCGSFVLHPKVERLRDQNYPQDELLKYVDRLHK